MNLLDFFLNDEHNFNLMNIFLGRWTNFNEHF